MGRVNCFPNSFLLPYSPWPTTNCNSFHRSPKENKGVNPHVRTRIRKGTKTQPAKAPALPMESAPFGLSVHTRPAPQHSGPILIFLPGYQSPGNRPRCLRSCEKKSCSNSALTPPQSSANLSRRRNPPRAPILFSQVNKSFFVQNPNLAHGRSL